MQDDSGPAQGTAASHTLDLELVEHELRDFPAVLGPLVTKESLDGWARGSDIRAKLLEARSGVLSAGSLSDDPTGDALTVLRHRTPKLG